MTPGHRCIRGWHIASSHPALGPVGQGYGANDGDNGSSSSVTVPVKQMSTSAMFMFLLIFVVFASVALVTSYWKYKFDYFAVKKTVPLGRSLIDKL